MRKSFKDSLKALEADIQHANTLASDYPSEYDGGCVQMRLSYSPSAQLFLFFIQWSDCNLASTLGLIRILIFKEYEDGKTSIYVHERKASIKEFYDVIFPSLLQLQTTEIDDRIQKWLCKARYLKKDEINKGKLSHIDMEREEECGICLEINAMVVLPDCHHSLCIKCYRSWRSRSQSCPFCRSNLQRVNSDDIWIYVSGYEVVDLYAIGKENLKILIAYIEKLPLTDRPPRHVGFSYDPCYR